MHGKFTYFWASQQARFRIYLASLCREEAHRNLCWTKPQVAPLLGLLTGEFLTQFGSTSRHAQSAAVKEEVAGSMLGWDEAECRRQLSDFPPIE